MTVHDIDRQVNHVENCGSEILEDLCEQAEFNCQIFLRSTREKHGNGFCILLHDFANICRENAVLGRDFLIQWHHFGQPVRQLPL